jgi:uncharacterized protein
MTLISGISVPVERIAEICRRYQVRELSLFGSSIRGDMRPESDIDILVEFDPDATVGILKFAALSQDLEALFGRRIDLVTKLGLKPWVRPHVLSEAKLVYAA